MSAGPLVTGEYELVRIMVARAVHGGEYQRLTLRQDGRWLKVHVWPNSYRGPVLSGAITRLWIAARAEVLPDGRHFYRLLDARILARHDGDARPGCEYRDLDLWFWSAGLTLQPLVRFCATIWRDEPLVEAFITRPASRWHHHSYRGGLGDHSLEVADFIGRLPLDPVQKELGQVAGLFHDLGKIRTLDADGRPTDLGRLVPHESLTLELLAPALARLDRDWPDGAAVLRHLWAYPRVKPESSPLRTLGTALRHADHLSAGLAAEKLAFAGQPPDSREGLLPGGGGRFWRPRPPEAPPPAGG